MLRAEPGKLSDIWYEAEALASQIDPNRSFYRKSDLSTLYRKAQETKNGLAVTFNGKNYPPMYTPRNQTLIDIFKITPDEETKMRTIISKSEKYRRLVAKRRADGVKERPDLSHRPWEALGISRRTWFRHRDG